ncbi:MAG TPA: hypothetical protein VLA28_09115, partial [Afifellaceae bacterium]|nr:hypothetical protein [Afifellaceae bacterium]
IEVDGRKISGTGGFFDGSTLFYQGTLLIDMNPADMIAALNVPQAKLAKRQFDSAAQRVVTLKELLGDVPDLGTIQQALLDGFSERLGLKAGWGEITAQEERLAQSLFDEEIGTDEFVAEINDPANETGVLTASHTGQGGTVNAHIRLEGAAQDRFREVLITGDFFVTPPRVVLDLEAHLRGRPAADCRSEVTDFFERADVGLLSIAPADFAVAIENAVATAK